MCEKIMLGAGCFWGVQYDFDKDPGVTKTTVGYSGGYTDNPTYKQVCSGLTGHAEVVLVEYDPEIVPLEKLLAMFWKMHDPTSLNRQGPDVGSQYRSAIYFYGEDQLLTIEKSKAVLNNRRELVTEIRMASTFWPAEDYHQKYFEKNGVRGCRIP